MAGNLGEVTVTVKMDGIEDIRELTKEIRAMRKMLHAGKLSFVVPEE